MKNNVPHYIFRIVFHTKCKLINFFTSKDKIPVFLRCSFVYKFRCGGCNITYYGKISAILKPECVNTLEFLLLLEKKVTGDIDSTINEHHLFCNHSPGFEKFSILAVNNNDFTLTLMESFSINRDHLPLDAFGTFYHMIAVYCSDYCPLILPRYCFIKWMVFYS